MTNEIKEIYLSNLEWTKTHDNDIKVNDMGGVIGNFVFKENMSYEEYQKLFKSGYFILCDKDYITNLQEENEKLKKQYAKEEKKLFRDNEILQQRIDKAVEYIDNHLRMESHYGIQHPDFEGTPSYDFSCWDLLDILRGDE